MTGRSRWLTLLGMAGFGLGLLRNQHALGWLSLTILLWLLVEWLLFHYRLLFDVPRLKITRTVNGRSESQGYLWAGRTATITVSVACDGRSLGPMLTIRDCVPENLVVRSGSQETHVLRRQTTAEFTFAGHVAGAGRMTLPGIRVTIQDPNGFFAAERFIPLEQSFRVLPSFAEFNEPHILVKRINSLPQHGIHRLQRAGMGSELLELREYVPGDPPKSIAWKVSARRDILMTRQYESEVPVRVYLFVDGSISTRAGGFGKRLLDQMLFVAGTVARSSISVGDPVGTVLFDERGSKRTPPQSGERGFYRILESLSDFAVNPLPPKQRLTKALVNAALRLAGERRPDLLDPRVNQVPFTFLPILPGARAAFYRRTLLAGVLAEIYGLTPVQLLELVHDDNQMAQRAQQFLAEADVSWMDPLVQTRGRGFHNGIASMQLVSKAITESVATARDNEVYVVMANLLECATNISNVLPAVKMALARHHRVVFVCPTPAFRRPGQLPDLPHGAGAEELLSRADDLRMQELTARLQRTLRRVGAAVTLSGEQEAIRMILTETSLARTGRVSSGGVR